LLPIQGAVGGKWGAILGFEKCFLDIVRCGESDGEVFNVQDFIHKQAL
jgi:hypothetical protein